jgi:hypothetical protein
MSSLVKVLVILFVSALVAGCKIAVIVVEGGKVQSNGSDFCLEGTVCIVEVTDTNFSESYTAVPHPGWGFVKWNTGGGFLCANSTDPTCTLSTVGTAGNDGIEAVIASDQTFYIMPIFEQGPDTVAVDGREWAQVDQFTDLSWSDINAVCPEGVCDGMLNGYNMTGWTWASVEDVTALFNHYTGSDYIFSGNFVGGGIPIECSVIEKFYNDGWRPLPSESHIFATAGWLAERYGVAWLATFNLSEGDFCGAKVGGATDITWGLETGFFWRIP